MQIGTELNVTGGTEMPGNITSWGNTAAGLGVAESVVLRERRGWRVRGLRGTGRPWHAGIFSAWTKPARWGSCPAAKRAGHGKRSRPGPARGAQRQGVVVVLRLGLPTPRGRERRERAVGEGQDAVCRALAHHGRTGRGLCGLVASGPVSEPHVILPSLILPTHQRHAWHKLIVPEQTMVVFSSNGPTPTLPAPLKASFQNQQLLVGSFKQTKKRFRKGTQGQAGFNPVPALSGAA